MSDAKNLSDDADRHEPEIFSESHPDPGRPVSGASAHIASGHPEKIAPDEISGATRLLEKSASFLLKISLVFAAAFAAGAALTILILMDLLDHKTGWLKDLLQFIKDITKLMIK